MRFWVSPGLGLDHQTDLSKDMHPESAPGLLLWDSPEGLSHSRKPRDSAQPACNPGLVFLDS